jgi:hypothetical protein
LFFEKRYRGITWSAAALSWRVMNHIRRLAEENKL